MIQLTKALALEYPDARHPRELRGARGVSRRPCSGDFKQLPDGADPEMLRRLMTPLGRSTPAEVAALIAFVASDEGRYMTGAVVPIDGGLTI